MAGDTGGFPASQVKPTKLLDALTVRMDGSLQSPNFELQMTAGVGATRQIAAPVNPIPGRRLFLWVHQPLTSVLGFYLGPKIRSVGGTTIQATQVSNASDLLIFDYNQKRDLWHVSVLIFASPAPSVDPYFSNVKLVFDFASSAGHGLVDLSTTPAVFTNNGSVAISTVNGDPFGDGLGSAGFAASTYISTDRAPASPTDICLEAWIYRTGTPGAAGRIITAQTGANALITLYLNTSNVMIFSTRESTGIVQTTITGVTTIPTNTWIHVAGSFIGAAMKLWVGGVLDGSASVVLDLAGAPVYEIGSIGIAASTQFFPGSIRAGRVTEGQGRYSATFTPPPAFYPLV